MLDFIKYSGLKLRERSGRCSPSGPSFKGAAALEVDLIGNHVSFAVPPHRPSFSEEKEKRIVNSRYTLEGHHYSDSVMPSQTWQYSRILYRSWGFYGAWFTGHMADLSCSVTVLKLTNERKDLSFFHPKVFETAVAGYITAYKGHYEDGGKARWKGPMNWRQLEGVGVPAVRFDVEPGVYPTSREHYVMFPISRSRIFCMSFSFGVMCSGSMPERDEAISDKPMRDLIDQIVGSIRLNLSADSKLALADVDSNLQDGLSEVFPPLLWPASVSENGLGVVSDGSPHLSISSVEA